MLKKWRNEMFRITNNKGFHIEFNNGWKVSVQFGSANYCQNYDKREKSERGEFSIDAEIAAFSPDGEMHKFPDGNAVQGWQSPEEVLGFMNLVSSFGREK